MTTTEENDHVYARRLAADDLLTAAIRTLNEKHPRYPDDVWRDECHVLRLINPLLESEVDAPVRMNQALNFLARFLLCCRDADQALNSFEEREGFGWLLLTIAQSMTVHEALLRAMPKPKPEVKPEPVSPEVAAKRAGIRILRTVRDRSGADRALFVSVLQAIEAGKGDAIRTALNGGVR